MMPTIKLFTIGMLLATTACAANISRQFYAAEFAGLAASATESLASAPLDYELDRTEGGVMRFKDCNQVAQTQAHDIAASQYSLFELLAVNCLALRRYATSSAATKSFFPAGLTKQLVAAFPAAAIPPVNEEDLKRRTGTVLRSYEKRLTVAVLNTREARLQTATDEIEYAVMARADFDNDGIEDLLVRAQSEARGASGVGVELFLLSKTSKAGQVTLIWRSQ